MPEEIKIPISAPGAEQAAAGAEKFSFTMKGLGSSVRTARGSLHEFHGMAHVLTSVMEGNLMGAVRGAGVAMRGLSHMALHPLILGMAGLAAGVYAAAHAWAKYKEEVERANQATIAGGANMQSAAQSAAPERASVSGEVQGMAHHYAVTGDREKLEKMEEEERTRYKKDTEALNKIQPVGDNKGLKAIEDQRKKVKQQERAVVYAADDVGAADENGLRQYQTWWNAPRDQKFNLLFMSSQRNYEEQEEKLKREKSKLAALQVAQFGPQEDLIEDRGAALAELQAIRAGIDLLNTDGGVK